VIALAVPILSSGRVTAASPQLEEGWRRCADRDADVSIAGCTAVIQSGEENGPRLATAFYDRGIAYRHKRQFDLAIRDYDEAIRLKPGDPEAFNNRGILHADTDEYDRAIEDFDRALRLKPSYAEAFYNRGNAHYQKSLHDRANQNDRAIRSRAPGAINPIDRAIQDYDRALRLKPGYAAALNNRGIAYYDKGQYDRAIQDYDQAIRFEPDLAEAFNNRALAYYKQNRYDRALPDFDQTIRLNKNYGNALINRALGAAAAPPRRPI
jgi:tetratricopeptide (TPR) repeat protein